MILTGECLKFILEHGDTNGESCYVKLKILLKWLNMLCFESKAIVYAIQMCY